jgi:hypothetical protein
MVYAVFGIYFYARESTESGEPRSAAPAPAAPGSRPMKK